jgi:hypothetical protein
MGVVLEEEVLAGMLTENIPLPSCCGKWRLTVSHLLATLFKFWIEDNMMDL